MNNENPHFFDSRTIIAILLIAITFIGWQYYMQQKYPQAFQRKPEVVTPDNKTVKPLPDPKNQKVPVVETARSDKAPEAETVQARAEEVIKYDSEALTFDLSSRGMGLKNYLAKKYKDRSGNPVHIGYSSESPLPFETRLIGQVQPLDFAIEKVNENTFVGRAQVGGLQVTKTLEIQPEIYLLKVKISTQGTDPRFIGLTTVLAEDVEPKGKSHFLLPAYNFQEFFVETSETHERFVLPEEDTQKTWSKVRLASIGSQYFTQAVLDRSNIMPEAKGEVNHQGKLASLFLQYPILNSADGVQIEYLSFIGPKSHYLLRQIDSTLAGVVNFGFFNWIARQILAMLHWFYGLVGNWGLAIILLTVVVRILVLPFNVYSYKSMKAMQIIQPKIQALRERYKDDQQKQQQELMALMREHKVNPLGGCLPVFLQFPIWLALYQVLGNSIELYQAPFGLWIQDLSLKDPYYILPVLMGATMFIQQKITPNTMDPAQAKILMMMPIIFTFFMVTLPSGLTLYMWVGAVFGVLQQMYFMRSNQPVPEALK